MTTQEIIESNFAILDVKAGRSALKKRVEAGERIQVIIHGTIDYIHSHDDGISREFSVSVTEVVERKP